MKIFGVLLILNLIWLSAGFPSPDPEAHRHRHNERYSDERYDNSRQNYNRNGCRRGQNCNNYNYPGKFKN